MKNKPNKDAGIAIAAGGYGCVFRPPINAPLYQTKINSRPYVTKVMSKRSAKAEMDEVTKFLPIIKTIKNYEKYFLLDDIFLAENFGPLTDDDKIDFNKKCGSALPGLTAANVNSNLSRLSALYIPDGGVALSSVLREIGLNIGDAYFEMKLGLITMGMINVLKNAIIPMNTRGIIHNDLKGGNMLITTGNIITNPIVAPDIKLIDWGLASKIPVGQTLAVSPLRGGRLGSQQTSYDVTMNMPLQYNAPFSIILFNSTVQADILKHTETRFIGRNINLGDFKSLAAKLLKTTQSKIGDGHFNYIDSILERLTDSFSGPQRGELYGIPQICINSSSLRLSYIIDYIADVLENFMVIETNGGDDSYVFNMEDYYYEVYSYNCDIWGFLSTFVDYVLSIKTKDLYLDSGVAQKIASILFKYCYSTKYASIKISIDELISDLISLISLTGISKPAIAQFMMTQSSPKTSSSSPKGSPPAIPYSVGMHHTWMTSEPGSSKTIISMPLGKKKCPKGYIKNKTTGKCHRIKTPVKKTLKLSLINSIISMPLGKKNCPKGYIKNKTTGKCHRK